MNLRLFVVAAGLLSASLVARADTINFSLTGAQGTASFSLSSTATPSSYSAGTATYYLSSAIIDGQTIANITLNFFTPAYGGALMFDGGGDIFNETGPQVFSGLTSAPIFQSQTFDLRGSGFVNGTAATGSEELTITITPLAATTPEPSSLLLLGTGALGLLGAVRRRRSGGWNE